MSSFKVKVLDIRGAGIKLGVWMIEPKQRFFDEDENFVLQLLWDGLDLSKRKTTTLGKAISLEQRTDPKWMTRNAENFIKAADIITTKNYPVAEEALQLTGKDFDKFWDDLKKVPYAEYQISVVDPKLLSHIRKGGGWDSSAMNYLMVS